MSRIMVPFNRPVALDAGPSTGLRKTPSLPLLEKDAIHFGTVSTVDANAFKRRAFSSILSGEVDLLRNLDALYRPGYHQTFLGRLEDSAWARETGIDVDEYVQQHETAILLVLHTLGMKNFDALLGHGKIAELDWVSLPALVESMEEMLQQQDHHLVELLVQAAQLCKKVELHASDSDTDITQQLRDLMRLKNIIAITSSIHIELNESRRDTGRRLLEAAADTPELALQDLLTWQHQASR